MPQRIEPGVESEIIFAFCQVIRLLEQELDSFKAKEAEPKPDVVGVCVCENVRIIIRLMVSSTVAVRTAGDFNRHFFKFFIHWLLCFVDSLM